MINFSIMTLFPDIINAYKNESMIKKAVSSGLICVEAFNIRDFSDNKHNKVDDYPYSGGGGMIMTPQPIFSTFEHVTKTLCKSYKSVYMSPKGRSLSNDIVYEYSKEENIVILCGHYEGVDQRVIDTLIDDEISIGDYVLTGGELPALVFTDAVSRFVEGFLSGENALREESHFDTLLEYPQYTRPYDFNGIKVPEILLSGHEANIKRWKRLMSIKMTIEKRPDIDISAIVTQEEINEAMDLKI